MVCSEIRSRFGVPVESLRYVMRFMVQNDRRDHLRAAVDMMQRGLSVFLMTDFKETFVMDSDLEFEDLLANGYFRADRPQAYVLIRVNDLVNRLLAATKQPIELKPNDRLHTLKAEADAAITACTPAEQQILRLLREEQCDQLTVRLKAGKVTRIEVEGDVSPETIEETAGILGTGDFETTTVIRHEGRVMRVRRKKPTPVPEKDNERAFFGGTWFTERGPKKSSS